MGEQQEIAARITKDGSRLERHAAKLVLENRHMQDQENPHDNIAHRENAYQCLRNQE
jgi:hypothetical protein